MASYVMNIGNEQTIGPLEKDYAKLPRSSGDGMECQSLSKDKSNGSTHSKVSKTVDETRLIETPTSSDKGAQHVDIIVSDKNPNPVHEVKSATALSRPSKGESESKTFTGEITGTNNSLTSDISLTHVDVGSNFTRDTSLSVERQAECLDLQTVVKDLETQNQKLAEENHKLLNKLSVQSKVNADLKKLLVASVGEDIGTRLEEMTADKAQFDTTLKNLEKDLEETSEELSKVSIECDVWRSKFLASRMMTNGLTDIKTTLFLKNRNCQTALQKLLEEQSDIRQHLRATNRLLQGIHERTNSTAYQSMKKNPWKHFQNSSIVELSHINYNLAEDICHVVNPGHFYATVDKISSADEEIIPVSDLTPAEQMACSVLKNDTDDADEMGVGMNKIGRQYIGNSYASRFLTNNFRITFDCCDRCTGPLIVV